MKQFIQKLRERHHHHHGRHEMHMMGRHGRGHGRFGGGFDGESEGGGRDFRAGRKLSSGDLQLVILALLEEKPRHGYEIIKAVEERSNGFYAPSPGMVYPALTYLEEVGQASVAQEGNKKCYAITAEGRAWLQQHRPRVEVILGKLSFIGEKMDRIREVFGERPDEERADHFAMHRGRAGSRFGAELGRACQEIRDVLHQHAGDAEPEQLRIAAILREAIRQIETGDAS